MSHSPPPPNPFSNKFNRFLRFIKKPKTIILATTSVTFVFIGYSGLSFILREYLPPWLEQRLSKVIHRPMEIGELQGFSFTSLQLDGASIPETPQHTNQLTAEKIKVTFNPLTILLERKLTLNISPESVKINIRENKPGQWLNVKATDEVIPLNFDLSVDINNTEISLLPYQSEKTVNIKVSGNLEYQKGEQRKWLYDIGLGLVESKEIKLQGETFVNSTKTQLSLQLNQLPLADWLSIFPNLPFNFDESYFEANLNLNLPSLLDLRETKGQGNLALEDLRGKITSLKQPIQADLVFQFEESKILIEQGKFILGDIITRLQGYYDWQQGSNIKIAVENFSIDNVFEVIPIRLPVEAKGNFNINFDITGLISNPLIQGRFVNVNTIFFEKTSLKTILGEFKISLNEILLEKFLIEPQVGGKIEAKGNIKQNITQLIKQDKPIDIQQFPIKLDFEVALPTEKLISPYNPLPSDLNLNLLQAKGKIKGKISDINGLIKWDTSGDFAEPNTRIISQGEIIIKDNNLFLKDTNIRTQQGIINIAGSGSLKTKKWQTYLNTEGLSLTPFSSIICVNITIQCPNNLVLQQGNIRLTGDINKSFLSSLDLDSNLLLSIDEGKVIINSNLENSNLQIEFTTLNLGINSFIDNLSVPILVNNSRIIFSGNLESIWSNKTLNLSEIKGNGDVVLKIEDSLVTVTGELEDESLAAVANINNLSIDQIIPKIPIPVRLVNSDINIAGNLRTLNFSNLISNLNNFQITANSDLLIANRSITANTEINEGIITGNVSLTPLSVAPFIIEGYPVIKVRKAETNFIGNLSSLLSLNFRDFQGNTNTEIEIAEGIVTIDGEINNDQIVGNITTENIDLSSLNADIFSAFTSKKLNSQINASLPLTALLTSDSLLPITVNRVYLEAGKQNLEAKGNFVIANIWSSPDIEYFSFNIDTSFNLDELPLTQLLDNIPINRQLLPTTVALTGEGNFTGTLLGKNLLTAPLLPGNLQIIGDVNLANLSFNDQQFEPELTGKIDIESSNKISFNIEGKQDKISAIFNPCLVENCPLTSIIDFFEIRQTYNNNVPILATVKRKNDNLVAKVDSLPIDVLKIAPLGNYGLPEYLQGLINLEISFNSSDLNTVGKLIIKSPRFGDVIADQFEALLTYKNNLIQLENTELIIGNSNYNIFANLDINSGEVQGKVDINQGNIEDLLIALQLYEWDNLLRLVRLKQPNFTTAENIQTNAAGNSLNSITEQLYQFWINDQKIEEVFAKTQAGDLPRQLDIKGQYNAEMILKGTINNPQIDIQFEGNKWTWTPQPSTASIVPSLGLIMEGSQVIPIEKIEITGQLQDRTISVNHEIKLGKATASGILNLSYNNADFSLDSSTFKVENLTLDLVRNLIIVPSDVNGVINVEGTLNGNLKAPIVDGIFEFKDGAINARLLDINLGGEFNYSNNKLEVATTQPEFINFSTTLPFPIVENTNDQFKITANLGKEAFTLLQPLTLDQIIWVGGEGDFTANVQGKISIDNQLRISLNSDSKINLNLNNAQLTNNLLPTVFTLNGEVNLNNRSLNVEQLTVDVVKTRLDITGEFPLLPLPREQIVNNPLTIQVSQDEVNESGFYQGLINGNLMITGALISPKIGGNIDLTEGKIQVPNLSLKSEEKLPLFQQWVGILATKNNIVIPPELNNLKINIDNISLKSERTLTLPKTFLNLSGNLNLNGKINSLSLAEVLRIEPSGQIRINNGQVNLPVTRVFISDQNENTLTFLPQQGLLNPIIDLELKLYIFAVALRSIQDNEIADDIVQSGRAKSAEITLRVAGSASEVLPNVGNIFDDVCQFNDGNTPPIATYNKTSPENLNNLARCIEISNLGANSIADLLRSPIVSFSSNPPLSNTELLTLFGQQLPDVVEKLQRRNSSQLVETGVIQSAVVILPFLQDWVFNANQQTTELGESLGLTNLRLFPVLETVYKLENKSTIRFSYDYTLNEATIRYESKF
ncbi:translocation/assembly module TamB domain-containing protein [Crocosphaera sp.]|uniref:translocation/assembly module TamB domain-containing protein n=1 Tax=Crocosphaera sp. TaxID=2729996 RepID=UPI002602C801|nr:translocation/assembly module TamB domain-containing protein [Crocosphaera sp.]MDJ0580340.1 translocation/assembly module TamB domain-containing protein [Crocosphaera sp.]